MIQVPFPMLFAEKMPYVDLNGEYDEQAQIFRLTGRSSMTDHPMDSYTVYETGTGGHGDTDQGVD